MLTIGKRPQKNLYKTLDSVQEQCYIINIQKHLNTKGARNVSKRIFKTRAADYESYYI